MLKRLIIMIGCLGLITAVHAVQVPHLYTAQIDVDAQATQPSATMLKRALQQVYVKVSGKMNVMTAPAIAEACDQAGDYVREFHYTAAPEGALQPFILSVQFDKAAVDRVLMQAQQSVWASNRPTTLLWIVIKDASGVHVIDDDSRNAWTLALQQAANTRGVPVQLPRMDLVDLQMLQPSDVWSNDQEKIRAASQRYAYDAMLVGSIDARNATQVTSHWVLQFSDDQAQWDAEEGSVQAVIEDAVNALSEDLSDRYAATTATSSSGQVEQTDSVSMVLEVSQLQGLKEYARVSHYLSHLSGVANMEVLDMQPTEATFQLTLDGKAAALQRTLALDKVLLPLDAQQISNGTLQYVYNRG